MFQRGRKPRNKLLWLGFRSVIRDGRESQKVERNEEGLAIWNDHFWGFLVIRELVASLVFSCMAQVYLSLIIAFVTMISLMKMSLIHELVFFVFLSMICVSVVLLHVYVKNMHA